MNLSDCIALCEDQLRTKSTGNDLYFPTLIASTCHSFLGLMDGPPENFTAAATYGERLFADYFKINVLSPDVTASQFMASLTATQLDRLGLSLVVASFGWAGWAKNTNQLEALKKVPQIHRHVDLCIHIWKASIEYFAQYSLSGVLFDSVPGILGGDSARAKQFFDAIQKNTKAPNTSCSMSGFSNYYHYKSVHKYVHCQAAYRSDGF